MASRRRFDPAADNAPPRRYRYCGRQPQGSGPQDAGHRGCWSFEGAWGIAGGTLADGEEGEAHDRGRVVRVPRAAEDAGLAAGPRQTLGAEGSPVRGRVLPEDLGVA